MKSLLVGLLAVTSAACAGVETLLESSNEETVATQTPRRINELYNLDNDQQRFAALQAFYAQTGTATGENIEHHKVAVARVTRNNLACGRGILLDDIGIILTVYHNIQHPGDLVTFNDGEIWPTQYTEILDPQLDYVILAADTGKPAQTYPLHFATADTLTPGTPVQSTFVTGNNKFTTDGDVITLEDLLAHYHPVPAEMRREYLATVRQLREYNEHGFLFTNMIVAQGHSGNMVETSSGTFCGLISKLAPCDFSPLEMQHVSGVYAEQPRHEGYAIITPAHKIHKRMEEYFLLRR